MTGRFAVDAGGSRTRALVIPAEGAARSVELGSVNPHATGSTADQTLTELLVAVRELLGDGPASGWLASAAAGPGLVTSELDRVRSAATRAGLGDAEIVVSNDVLPLLWGVPALSGTGVVAVCGTGSGFFGSDGRRVVNVGGCEYLGSDEGGAVDIGRHGLRAAVRATDGRGPATALVEAFAETSGQSVAALARGLAAAPFPKQGLAELAPVVCATWLAGDDVAGSVIRQAVGDLAEGVNAARAALALPAGFAVAATGGVFLGCPPLYREFVDHLTGPGGAGSVDLVTDTTTAVLAALDHFTGEDGIALPTGLTRYAGALSPRRRHDAGIVLGGVR